MHSTSFTPLYKKGYAFMRSLTREHIESLVEKKLSGTITPGEQALLDQWLNREQEGQMIWNSDNPDEPALRERLLKRIKKDAGISNYSRPAKRIPVWPHYRWAAAVILLLITGSLGYFLLFKKSGATVDTTTNKKIVLQDIAPGHNGAILTLAKGNKIVLDSASNGKIAMQGNRRLIKKDGELIYEKAIGEASSKSSTASDDNVTYNTLVTPRGRKFQIVLSDGTKVWLNAASSITYPTAFTGKERKVTVTGEVYFEVAPLPRPLPPKERGEPVPFIVSVGKAKITVLGTHFNVMAYTDEKEIKTTLLEGAVKVSYSDQHVIITPGQQASFSAKSDHISVATVDTRSAVAWVKGKLSLDNLGLEAIMRKVSRWYDVDIEFEGPVPQEHFWGLINRDVNLLAMLKIMRASGIEVNLKGNKVIVSSDN